MLNFLRRFPGNPSVTEANPGVQHYVALADAQGRLEGYLVWALNEQARDLSVFGNRIEHDHAVFLHEAVEEGG